MKILMLLTCLVSCFSLLSCSSSLKKQPIKPLTLNGDREHMQLTPIKITEPKWPIKYLRRGQEGWVKVGFNLSPKGKPLSLKVIDSSPKEIFNDAAINAIKNWRFKIPQDYNETNTYVYSMELKLE